jgi:hypothetical protein
MRPVQTRPLKRPWDRPRHADDVQPLRAVRASLRPAWTSSPRRDQRPGRGDGQGVGSCATIPSLSNRIGVGDASSVTGLVRCRGSLGLTRAVADCRRVVRQRARILAKQHRSSLMLRSVQPATPHRCDPPTVPRDRPAPPHDPRRPSRAAVSATRCGGTGTTSPATVSPGGEHGLLNNVTVSDERRRYS